MSARRAAIRQAGHYRRIEIDHCAYCGDDLWDSLDHVPPVSAAASLADLDIKTNRRLYPSCRECNSLLGAVFLECVVERRRLVARKLAERYEATLTMPDWSDEELGELGEGMRRSAIGAMRLKIELQKRLHFARFEDSTFDDDDS